MSTVRNGKIDLDVPGGSSTGGYEQGKLFFNEWTHFAVVRDANLLHTIYRNGEVVGTVQAASLDFEKGTGSIAELGYAPNGNEGYGSGNLDEVRFWNYARSAQEIQQNLYKEVNPNDSGLFVYYQFNDNWSTQIEDRSGNGNYLALPNLR